MTMDQQAGKPLSKVTIHDDKVRLVLHVAMLSTAHARLIVSRDSAMRRAGRDWGQLLPAQPDQQHAECLRRPGSQLVVGDCAVGRSTFKWDATSRRKTGRSANGVTCSKP